jgi:predicted type IV restriction endonuclease
MDFIDEVRTFAKSIPSKVEKILTEEGTKTTLVMPFIRILGYDPFNLSEVNPEYVADVGTKKGEKVDYAIMKDGEPIILFECKMVNTDLNKEQASQLHRYFHNTPAKIGVLTNGIVYRFFTDIDNTNKMDGKPFLEIDLLDIKEPMIAELKKFTKQQYDPEQVESNATQLKYTREIIQILNDEFLNPSDDFVEYFARKVYPRKYMLKTKEKFKKITKESLDQFLSDKINERLKSAMASTDTKQIDTASGKAPQSVPDKNDEKIITTGEEWEGYYFVKAILNNIISPSKIFIRDQQSYCSILYDDNNRTPICRLYFNTKQKYVGFFDNEKRVENKIPIAEVSDLFKLADHIKNVIAMYEKK